MLKSLACGSGNLRQNRFGCARYRRAPETKYQLAPEKYFPLRTPCLDLVNFLIELIAYEGRARPSYRFNGRTLPVMVTFVAKSTLLLVLNLAVGLAYTAYLDSDRDYAPWETGICPIPNPKR